MVLHVSRKQQSLIETVRYLASLFTSPCPYIRIGGKDLVLEVEDAFPPNCRAHKRGCNLKADYNWLVNGLGLPRSLLERLSGHPANGCNGKLGKRVVPLNRNAALTLLTLLPFLGGKRSDLLRSGMRSGLTPLNPYGREPTVQGNRPLLNHLCYLGQ